MFVSKLVCDKCGTEASTTDKYCRECGEIGKSNLQDDSKPNINDWQGMLAVETRRCKTCGQIVTNYGHDCPGLFGNDPFGISIRYN